jgi:hypothetical protein
LQNPNECINEITLCLIVIHCKQDIRPSSTYARKHGPGIKGGNSKLESVNQNGPELCIREWALMLTFDNIPPRQ